MNVISVWNKSRVEENNDREISLKKKTIPIVNVGSNKHLKSYNVFVNVKLEKYVKNNWYVQFKIHRDYIE